MRTARKRNPIRTATVAFALAWLAGCAAPGDEVGIGGAGYPGEKTAADYPGVRYPDHSGGIPAPASSGGPVWLIGVDGATWDVIRPLAERGDLPNFAAMMERGAHGALLSEEPTISPALWATVATGVPRHVHGVDNFLVKLPGSFEVDEAGPLDRRHPALWELVGAAGGNSAVIGWFGSYPAEQIPGVYISKGFDPDDLRPGQVHPEAFAGTLAGGARVRLRPIDVEQIPKNASLQNNLVEDARAMAALRAIVAESSPELVAVYFSGIDVAQHLTWRHMDPKTRAFPQDGPPDPALADVIPAYYRFIDHCLGEIRALAPDDATLVVVSDHGAGPMRVDEAFHFQLEVLLETLGLMDGDRGLTLAISELYRHDKRIWLNLAEVESMGTVAVDEADSRAQEVERRLTSLRTDDGEALLESIVRHTADENWRPGDPALTVRFSRAALWTDAAHEGTRVHDFAPVRLRHTDVSGSHRLEGVLILEGPEVRPGPLGPPANLYHLAPTVLQLLGLPQDERMLRHAPADGGVIETAFDPERLAARPIRMVSGYPGTDRSGVARAPRGEGEELDPARQESMEKLRSLGYIR